MVSSRKLRSLRRPPTDSVRQCVAVLINSVIGAHVCNFSRFRCHHNVLTPGVTPLRGASPRGACFTDTPGIYRHWPINIDIDIDN